MKRIIFSVTNDLVYDQRMQKICTSLATNGFEILLLGFNKKNSKPLSQKKFKQHRLGLIFQKGPLFFMETNLRLFMYLLFHKADVLVANDLDTALPVLFASVFRRAVRVFDAHELFCEMHDIISRPRIYRLKQEKVWVFPPVSFLINAETFNRKEGAVCEAVLPPCTSGRQPYTFIFPATAFYYKNHAVILEACRLLAGQHPAFKVWLTIDGTENKYVKGLVARAKKSIPQIEFLGFVNREDLFRYYTAADCMIFPSLLESWGLPLTEFACLGKPIICADLPYGRATLASTPHDFVAYFDPTDATALAEWMSLAIRGKLVCQATDIPIAHPFGRMHTWEECFRLLLNENKI